MKYMFERPELVPVNPLDPYESNTTSTLPPPMERPKLVTNPDEVAQSDLDLRTQEGLIEAQKKPSWLSLDYPGRFGSAGQILAETPAFLTGAAQGIGGANLSAWGQWPNLRRMQVDSQLVNATKALEAELAKPVESAPEMEMSPGAVSEEEWNTSVKGKTLGKVSYQNPARVKELQEQINQYKNDSLYYAEFSKAIDAGTQEGWMKPPENQSLGYYLGRQMGQVGFQIGQTVLLQALGVPVPVATALTQVPLAAGQTYGEMANEHLAGQKGATDFAKLDALFTKNAKGEYKTDELARWAMLDGAFQALSEAPAYDKLLGGMPGGAIRRFFKGGTIEGLQEVVAQLESNFVQYGQSLDPKTRQIWRGLIDSFIGGFGAGAPTAMLNPPEGEPMVQRGEKQQAQRQAQPQQALKPPTPEEAAGLGWDYDIEDAEFRDAHFVPRLESEVMEGSKRRVGPDGQPMAYYDLKPGEKWTRHTLAAALELNFGYSSLEAQVNAAFLQRRADSRGISFEDMFGNMEINPKDVNFRLAPNEKDSGVNIPLPSEETPVQEQMGPPIELYLDNLEQKARDKRNLRKPKVNIYDHPEVGETREESEARLVAEQSMRSIGSVEQALVESQKQKNVNTPENLSSLVKIVMRPSSQYPEGLDESAAEQVVAKMPTERKQRLLWAVNELKPSETLQDAPGALKDTIPGTHFYLALPTRIKAGETRLSPTTPLSESQLIGRFVAMPGIKKAELEAYEMLGLKDFISKGKDGKRTVAEVAQWMEENGPKVEVVKLGTKNTEKSIYDQWQELGHQLDTEIRTGDWRQIIEGDDTWKTLTSEQQAMLKKEWALYEESVAHKNNGRDEGYTARGIAVPKSVEQMPGAVDLLVRIPFHTINPETGNKIGDFTKIKYESDAKIPQEPGMRLHYDPAVMLLAPDGSIVERFPAREDAEAYAKHNNLFVGNKETEYKIVRGSIHEIAEKLTGSKAEMVEFGMHQNTTEGTEYMENGVARKQPRSNLLFKNADGTPKTSITARLYALDKAPQDFPLLDTKSSTAKDTLGGFIHFKAASRQIVQLFSNSQPDTLIHEFSHLIVTTFTEEEQQAYAEAYARTAGKKQNAAYWRSQLDTYLNTGGISPEFRPMAEWFANGFTVYLATNKAPTAILARLYASMKEMLRTCYRMATRAVKVDAGTQKFFDSILMKPEELVRGAIEIPTRKVRNVGAKSESLEIQGKRFKLTLKDGLVHAIMDDKSLVNVNNLIRGGLPTAEQVEKFGAKPEYISEYRASQGVGEATSQGGRISKLPKGVSIRTVTMEKLEGLGIEQLRALGQKLCVDNYDTLTQEELLQEIIQAKQAKATDGANSESLEDAVLRDESTEGIPGVLHDAPAQEEGESTRGAAVSLASVKQERPRTRIKDSLVVDSTSKYLTWTSDRVRLFGIPLGQLPTANMIQEKRFQNLKTVEDRTYKIKGLLEPLRVALQQLVRTPNRVNLGASELSRLHEGKWAGRTVSYVSEVIARSDAEAMARFQLDPSTLSQSGQKILRALKALTDETARLGKLYKMGIEIERRVNGKWVKVLAPFEPQGARFPRIYTRDFWSIITSPDVAIRRRLAEGICAHNADMTPIAVEQWITSLQGDVNTNKRIFLEVSRKIPIMPSHLVMPNGRTAQLLETNLFNYAEQLQMRTATRMAFHSVFATPPVGAVLVADGATPDFRVVNTKVLDYMVKQFDQETKGGGKELQRALRAANGVPIEEVVTNTPDTPGYVFIEALKAFYRVRIAGQLSTTFRWNIFETIGSTLPMTGNTAYGKAIAQAVPRALAYLPQKAGQRVLTFFDGVPRQTAYEALRNEISRWGAMSEHLAYAVIDPKNKLASISRMTADAITKFSGNTGIYGFNELIAGLSTRHMIEKWSQGEMSHTDQLRLRFLNFTPQQIAELATGRASEELQQSVVTRIVPYTQATNTLMLNRSLAGNNRLWKELVRFDSFGRNKLRQVAVASRQVWVDWNTAPSLRERNMRALAAGIIAAEGSIGTIASGLGGLMLAQGIRYGAKSLLWYDWDKDDEDKNGLKKELARTFADCLIMGTTSGLLAGAYKQFKEGKLNDPRNLGEYITSSIYPFNATVNDLDFAVSMARALAGAGDKETRRSSAGFGGMTPGNIAYTYMTRSVPILGMSPMSGMVALIFHTAYPDPKLAFAKKQFYDFRDNRKMYEKEDSDVARKLNAVAKLLEGKGSPWKDGEFQIKDEYGRVYSRIDSYLKDALRIRLEEGDQNAAREIRKKLLGRRLLPRIPVPDRARFQRSVKPEMYQTLEEHDHMWEMVANRFVELANE